MSATLFPAYAAVIFGVALAVVLVVPFAAIQYRRRGGLTVGIVALDFLVLLSLVAIATYTLLPLPVPSPDFCAVHDARPQLVPGRFVADIIREASLRGGGLSAYVRNPALLQIVFNIALFVPLGMIVRHFTRKPVLVAAAVGFGVSLLVEVTQVTGVWFLYPCAYRLFDVDDLLVNTLGALLGAFLAPVLRLFPGQVAMRPGDPRPLTALRRLLGMLCDWVVVTVGGLAVVAVYLLAVPDRGAVPDGLDSFVRFAAGGLLLSAVQLVWVLASGRTVGESVVRLEPRPPARLGGRLLRWLLGVGGYSALTALQSPVVASLLIVAVLASIVAVLTTRDHRGLAYVAARWELRDDRSASVSAAP